MRKAESKGKAQSWTNIVQWLRALINLPEDPGSIPRSTRLYTTLYNIQGIQCLLWTSAGIKNAWGGQTKV